MSIQAVGLVELIGELGVASASIEAKAREAEDKTKNDIRDTAVSNVPVLTRELQDSIEVTEDGVEATAPHAEFVEFGTYKDAPQPYMGPAADAHEPEFVKAIEDAGEL